MGYLLTAFELIKGLNPKVILAGVVVGALVAIAIWAYFKYDIVEASFIKKQNKLITTLQKELKTKNLSIHNLSVEVARKESAIEAIKVEKDTIEYECNLDKEDFNENTVDPDADHLPF